MIYVVKHKQVNILVVLDGYKQLGVGKLYKGNNTEINKLNPYINEVTAMYDMWGYDDEIIGLVHYRRYFRNLTMEKAEKILQDYDVITTPLHSVESAYKHLCNALDSSVVDKYIGMLPLEVQKWFYECNEFNICNMFVSKNEFFTKYCEWLFPKIIPMCERFVKEDVTTDYKQNRTIGFIAECLFGYYCKDYKRYFNPVEEILV